MNLKDFQKKNVIGSFESNVVQYRQVFGVGGCVGGYDLNHSKISPK